MDHAEDHPSGFGSFLMGAALIIIVIAAVLFWTGSSKQGERTAAVDARSHGVGMLYSFDRQFPAEGLAVVTPV